MEENKTVTATPEQALPRELEITTSPTKGEEAAVVQNAAPESGASPAAKKKPPLKLILIGAAALAAIITVTVILISRSSPSSIAKRYIQALYTNDKTATSLWAFDFNALRLSSYDGSEEEFFEAQSDELSADITSWSQFYKATDQSYQEELEDEFGKYKVSTEVTRTRDISVKKLLEETDWWIKILEKEINFDSDSIADARVITVKAKITGEDDIERTKYDVYVVKIGGTWGVLDYESTD